MISQHEASLYSVDRIRSRGLKISNCTATNLPVRGEDFVLSGGNTFSSCWGAIGSNGGSASGLCWDYCAWEWAILEERKNREIWHWIEIDRKREVKRSTRESCPLWQDGRFWVSNNDREAGMGYPSEVWRTIIGTQWDYDNRASEHLFRISD